MRKVMMVLVVLFSSTVAVAQDAPGCVKDTECKGDRICENHACVAPHGSTLQSGQPVVEEHKASEIPAAPRSADAPIQPKPLDMFTYTLGFDLGIMFVRAPASNAVAPEIGMYGEAGGYVSNQLAVAGYADLQWAFDAGGRAIMLSFGPELKIGRKQSVSIGAGGSYILAGTDVSPTISLFAPSGMLRGSIPVGPVCIHGSIIAAFLPSGTIISPTVGVGYTQ